MQKIFYTAEVFTNLQVLVAFWCGFFILYLIVKSTQNDRIERYGVKDMILGRKVPMIVFIKNKSLLKRIYESELTEDVIVQQ